MNPDRFDQAMSRIHERYGDAFRDARMQDRVPTQAELDTVYAFWDRHPGLVERRLMQAEKQYAPSGSDRIRPELWKPAHWSWFNFYYGPKPPG